MCGRGLDDDRRGRGPVRPAGEHAALLGTHRLGQPGAARRLKRAPALPSRGRRDPRNAGQPARRRAEHRRHARLPGQRPPGRRGGRPTARVVRGPCPPPGRRGGRTRTAPSLSGAQGPLLERPRGRRPGQGRLRRRGARPDHPPHEPKGQRMTTTRVTSPFGFESTATEVIAAINLHDRRALVTGAASGIGVETARALASAGAETVIAARDLAAAERTAADIRATTGNPAVSVARLDLLHRGSVDQLVRDLAGPLHILVNNAGVMAVPELRRSLEGHELQFATNHLGHFRLALGLLPALRAAGGARVVSVSSRAHLTSPVIFDDIDFRHRPYDPALAYAQSKTANVLFAVAAARHWSGDGIEVNALHPGPSPTPTSPATTTRRNSTRSARPGGTPSRRSPRARPPASTWQPRPASPAWPAGTSRT